MTFRRFPCYNAHMMTCNALDYARWLKTDPEGFLRGVFPEMSLRHRGVALRALKRGKRVCIWSRVGYVLCCRPPLFTHHMTDDCCQPAGDYGYLVVIDLLEKKGSRIRGAKGASVR